MFAVAVYALKNSLKKQISVASANDVNLLGSFASRHASCSNNSEESCTEPKTLRRRAVQVVHRHGDRSPITLLKDEAFWASHLVSASTLSKISSNTHVIKPDAANTHNANGRGPFGKLTKLGLLQIVDLGTSLREQLSGDNQPTADEKGRTLYPHIWTPEAPLSPASIRVISTNFLRTVQSVQGLLAGLFPDGTEEVISIDTRHTNWMIPDPQPRRSPEQAALEEQLADRPRILAREEELLPLAIRATHALSDMLAPDARDADFGAAQKSQRATSAAATSTGELQPLSWNQLAEITKCLAVRDLLPEGISKEDQEAISQHAAWRWFEAFRHPRLAHLAIGTLTEAMVGHLQNHSREPPMTVWSAHDSTLICLMCAFRLEQPAVWPEYGSYLMLELIQVDEDELYVRFSLNGQVLISQWDDGPVEMIPLTTLAENIASQGSGVQSE